MKVEKILDEMDVKAPQVALSTVIGELTLSNNEEFGVDWFAKYKTKLVGISRNNTIFSEQHPGNSGSQCRSFHFTWSLVGTIIGTASSILRI